MAATVVHVLSFTRQPRVLVVVANRALHGDLDVVVDTADPIVLELRAVPAEYSAGAARHGPDMLSGVMHVGGLLTSELVLLLLDV